MTVWMQLAAALTAAIASGVMGMALVPFLRKLRFCEPEIPDDPEKAAAQPKLLPTMGGILLVFGCLTGMVISYALSRTSGITDSTSAAVQQELRETGAALGYAVLCAAMGFAEDLQLVRRRTIRQIPKGMQFLVIFLLTGAFLQLTGMESTVLEFGFWRYDAGVLYLPLTAAGAALLWMCAARMEETPDGTGISVGAIVLLSAAVVLIQNAKTFPALLSLAAAGACMGCFVWSLHPAKCRIGRTGTFWLCGMITAVCLLTQQHLAMLLLTAAYPVNLLPALRKRGCTLQKQMADAGMKHWQQIAVPAGFALFSGMILMII